MIIAAMLYILLHHACVHDKICCFGEIGNDRMRLNDYGKIADKQWLWLATQYSCVILHSHIITSR
jgi:putative transposase